MYIVQQKCIIYTVDDNEDDFLFRLRLLTSFFSYYKFTNN